MKINFQNCRVHLIVTPTDLRSGCARLMSIALDKLGVDVLRGEDVVVFVSKSRGLCKVVFADDKGSSMITRMLRCGKFEQILVKSNQPGKVSLTVRELEKFLNGEYLYERRENYYPKR